MTPAKITLISLIFLFVISTYNITYAKRGCCSWHQGVNHCDDNTGQIVCNDGSYSPSCLCEQFSKNPKFHPKENMRFQDSNY